MKKAVVTEAMGFIGFHLCSRLLEEGIEVAAIDNLRNGRDKEEKENKLDYFGRNALFHFYNGEMSNLSVRETFEETDVCFYLTPSFLREEEEMYKALHDAFENIRIFHDAVVRKHDPFFILVSSTDVYGRVSGRIEESEAISPLSLQGMLALVHESLFDFKELPLSVLRFPEIYGPGQPSAGSFHKLLHGAPPDDVPLDLLYIKDAVEALIAAADKSLAGVFNIASGRSDQWKRAEAYITDASLPEDGTGETWFSIDKARAAFGVNPETSLEQGIEEQKDC
ncbi:MAG TPA: NAD(P)-dependent oxidoreductase [Bacillales bacterium]